MTLPHSHLFAVADLPWFLRSRSVRWIWSAAVLAILALSCTVLGYQWKALETQQLEQLALFARAVSEQVTRGFDTTGATLRTLANNLPPRPLGAESITPLNAKLSHTLDSLPFLHNLSLVDAEHRILASAKPAIVGAFLQTPHVVWLEEEKGHMQDNWRAPSKPDGQEAGRNVSQIKGIGLALSVSNSDGSPLFLVADWDPDYFRRLNAFLLGDHSTHVVWSSNTGLLLASNESIQGPAGQSIKDSVVFQNNLSNAAHGEFIGPAWTPSKEAAKEAPKALTAFHVMRPYPVVVTALQMQAPLTTRLWPSARGVVQSALLALLLLSAAGVMVRRSLRRHEGTRQQFGRAHRALQINELRTLAVLEASLDGVITIDERGHILEFNAASERMFGLRREQILGHVIHELIEPTESQESPINMANAMRLGDKSALNKRIESTAKRADGSVFPIELSIVPAQADGETFFAATLRDITQSRQIETERTSLLREYHKVATDLSSQKKALDQHAIVVIANAHGQITYANQKFLEISGHVLTDIRGRDLRDVIASGPDQLLNKIELQAKIYKGKVWHGELVNARADGRLYWLAGTIVPVLNEEGHPREFISIHTDISPLKLAELELAAVRSRELAIGVRIQKSLLVNPKNPGKDSLWLSACSQASQGINGDFVEVLQMGPDCIDVVLADVMGKGIPAALMGAATKMQMNHLIADLMANSMTPGQIPSPSQIVTVLHESMTAHLQALDAFVTLIYLRVDTAAQTVTWVGCGHEEPVILRAQGGQQFLENQCLPLGVLNEPDYVSNTTRFAPGDALFLCSDGLPDAELNNGERIGQAQLMQIVQRLYMLHDTPATVLYALQRELRNAQVTPKDDATMMYLLMRDRQERATCVELPVDMTSIGLMRQGIANLMAQAGLSEEHEDPMNLYPVACVESLTNIVRHAKGLEPDAPIEMIGRVLDQGIETELVYLGEPYLMPSPKDSVDLSQFPEGGFGLTIIQNACDEVEYSAANGVNRVRLRRYASTRSKR